MARLSSKDYGLERRDLAGSCRALAPGWGQCGARRLRKGAGVAPIPGGRTMIIRASTLLSAVSLIVALAVGPAAAAEFATKEEAIAMVKKAVALINERGPDQAYAEFTKKGGRFHDRDLYITVLDLEGKVLAHGQREDLIGKVLIEAKDPDGKLFV